MTDEEKNLLNKAIIDQLKVIQYVQSLMLEGELEITTEREYFLDNPSRIKTLSEGLSYLIGCKHGSTLRNIDDTEDEEDEE